MIKPREQSRKFPVDVKLGEHWITAQVCESSDEAIDLVGKIRKYTGCKLIRMGMTGIAPNVMEIEV